MNLKNIFKRINNDIEVKVIFNDLSEKYDLDISSEMAGNLVSYEKLGESGTSYKVTIDLEPYLRYNKSVDKINSLKRKITPWMDSKLYPNDNKYILILNDRMDLPFYVI